MKELYLCPHYGFGDYVVCYGLIKELAKSDDIVLLAKPHRSHLQMDNIRRLYSSIKNVQISEDDPKLYKDVLYIGWDRWQEAVNKDPNVQFQEFFYAQAGVPLNLLWNNFYFERDFDKEERIYYKLGLRRGEYVFLHDDPQRNFIINMDYVLSDLRVVHLNDLPEVSILDSLLIIENAREVHMTNTGLVSFVDQMKIEHSNLNYHRYPRPLPFEQPILKLNWKIWKS